MNDNDNIDNDDGAAPIQVEQQQQHQQQQHAAAAAAAAARAARTRRKLKLNTILDCQEDFPLRQRIKMDELTERYLNKLSHDIHSMLCAMNMESEEYHGLDSDRDTEAEVATALRYFPEVVSRRGGQLNECPIHVLTHSVITSSGNLRFNLKALPFVPIVAQIAIEINAFEEEQYGGLLCKDRLESTPLYRLMESTNFVGVHNQRVDSIYLTQLIRLRHMGIIKKEDIHNHDLVFRLFVNHYFFSERRFRFLVEWDPTVLTQTRNYGRVLLHQATRKCTFQGFQVVFDYVIRYYPKKLGVTLLFQKTNNGVTPFQSVCKKYGCTAVLEVVEEVLTRYHSQETTQLDSIEALLSAAINKNLHLDCAYFLLRRQPDVLIRLLSGPRSNNNSNEGIDDGGDTANLNDDDDNGIECYVNHDNEDGNNNDSGSGDSGGGGGGVDDDDDDGGNGIGDIEDGQHNGVVVVRKRKRGV